MANNDKVFFSVIIPCYNAAATIGRCLDSCLAQSCRDFEVIVVDDASTDRSCDIIRVKSSAFAALQIRFELVVLPQNLGQASARNLGWEKANGACIAFLDADDFWHSSKLAVVGYFLRQRPDIELLAHRYTERANYSSGTFELKSRHLLRHPRESGDLSYLRQDSRLYPLGHKRGNGEESCDSCVTEYYDRGGELAPEEFKLKPVSFRRLLFKNVAACPCWVVRASLPGRFDQTMRFSEDRDLWLRMAHRHRCALLNGPPLTFLGRPQHSTGGISSNKLLLRLGEMRVYLHAVRLEPAILPLLPILFVYSLLKAMRREILLLLQVDGGEI